jgi:hypothetical protein
MIKSRFLLMLLPLALCGCDDFYRYKCQDPKNWETAECKPPICTVTQTCPEDLLKPEVLKGDVR